MKEALALIFCGGTAYVAVELCWRGRSHWSMFLLGGVLFWLIGLMDEVWPGAPLSIQVALGTWTIVCAEFLTGMAVNRLLGLGVWDYTNQKHNLMGQICLPFTLLWFPLCGIGILFENWIRHALFGEPTPKYRWVI